ncbi:hypothetical protein M0R72_21530 [Candidatus Pacearchaeota archaeon]|nr:hypothetical protein [Candidatus Pacearchaeota archaeon]
MTTQEMKAALKVAEKTITEATKSALSKFTEETGLFADSVYVGVHDAKNSNGEIWTQAFTVEITAKL